MSNQIRVIIDSSQKNTSLLYASGFYCIDPFVFIDTGKKRIAWLPSTEFEKAKKNSKLTEINNLNIESEKINKSHKSYNYKSSLIIKWLTENKIKEILIPESFPSIELQNLKKNKIKVIIVEEENKDKDSPDYVTHDHVKEESVKDNVEDPQVIDMGEEMIQEELIY